MKAKRSFIYILVTLILLSAVLTGCQSAKGDFTPLTAGQKANILEAYKTEYCSGEESAYQQKPLIWFDENGGKRDPGVFRYFGTYGDCIVLLQYGDGQYDYIMMPIEQPITMGYLAYPVQYPVDCEIVLYNKNPNCRLESRNRDYDYDLLVPICSLSELKLMKINWLTWPQLYQLTTDLENWITDGNY